MTSIITPRRLLTAAALTLALGACSGDSTGPNGAEPGLRRTTTTRLMTDGSTDGTTSGATATNNRIRFASWAPRLTTYDTTFTVIQGQASADTLFFTKRSTDWGKIPFLILTTPNDGQFVDAKGRSVPQGTAVKLTVHVDSTYVDIQFGPHGSTFSKSPAKLKIFWLFTDLGSHLGSDLNMWYQPVAGTTWTKLATTVNLEYCWLMADIDHFSNYHIAY